jgi:hypothetical protein
MKPNRRTWLPNFQVLCCVALAHSLCGHEVVVHENITLHAESAAGSFSKGYQAFSKRKIYEDQIFASVLLNGFRWSDHNNRMRMHRLHHHESGKLSEAI